MRQRSIAIGARWGKLKCVGKRAVQIVNDEGNGVVEKYTADVYELRCDCGKSIEVEVNRFLGKRLVRDCGCGLDKEVGPSMILTISCKAGLVEEIEQAARVSGMSRSEKVVELVRKGLESNKSDKSGKMDGNLESQASH
jgi:hypothetical protein